MKLYNTLSRTIEPLQSNNGAAVSLYTCGLTVYSQPHIGNWAAYIYWDILVRTLQGAGYTVNRVQNITDVGHLTSDEDSGEDKMEKGARREGLTAWDIAEKYIQIADHEAYNLLALIRPQHMPRATDFITQQIAFVQALEDRGYTYRIDNDGIYFDTSKLEHYGELAQLDIAGLQPGVRIAADNKKHITDFALWKFSPSGPKRDMEWDSPWGVGFPGWHLECSVMARELLGDQIDIHTGGIDHIPVHHTNEIAQTEAVTGKQFARMWLHNNHLKVNGTKISKSLGNIYTLQDIVDKGFSLMAYKLLVLSSHYRTGGNFTWDILSAAQNRLHSYQALADLRFQISSAHPEPQKHFEDYQHDIQANLEHDLSTPQALAVLSELADATTNGIPPTQAKAFLSFLQYVDGSLGLQLLHSQDISADQKQHIAQREEARNAQDWATSDTIRKHLATQGIGLRDTPTGSIWYRI